MFRSHASSVLLLLLETRLEDFGVPVRSMSLLLLWTELQQARDVPRQEVCARHPSLGETQESSTAAQRAMQL